MIYIIVAFLAGILTLLSMIVNSSLGKRIGVLQSCFVNYIVGLICTAILCFTVSGNAISINNLNKMPLWAYFGGALGVIVVIISNIIIPKIPTVYSTLLIFIGQLFTGILIDFFMGLEISWEMLIGGLLIVAGMTYNSIVDKKHMEANENEIGG